MAPAAPIRSHHRRGVSLVGHSFTGLLSFEVAHQLQARGRGVDMIVLLDAWAKEAPWWSKLPYLSFRQAQIAAYRLVSKLSRLSKAAATPPAASTIEASYQSLDEMSWETFQHVVRNALKRYRLTPLNSRGVLFRARASHKAHLHAFDPWLGWSGLFSRGLDVVDVPGDHSSLLLHANLAGLSKQFQEYLNTIVAENQRKPVSKSAKPLSVAANA